MGVSCEIEFAARPDMALVGCHFIVLDWER